MNYFMSGIYGDAKAYFTMKAKIGFNSSDHLYILGNLLDGNSKYPEYCLAMLEDIMSHSNISLLLGEYEYAYVMSRLSDYLAQKMEVANSTGKQKLNGDADSLQKYMSRLPKKKQDQYLQFLFDCELSDMIRIGKRFFYLVSGAPALNDKDIGNWKKNVAGSAIELNRNYRKEIESDPEIVLDKDWNYEDTIIICSGRKSREKAKRNLSMKGGRSYQKVIFEGNKMLIDCSYQERLHSLSEPEPTLACVSVDEEGYSVVYKYDL